MSNLDVLLPYQKKWVADEANVKICEKSRRIGLTWAEAADCVLSAAASDGMDIFYVGYNKDLAQEFVETCGSFAKGFNYVVGEIEEDETIFKDEENKSILAYIIRFASGHKIVALSSRPSNLRGRQGRVVIDEAAFHDDLDQLLKAAMAFLMWGGKVVIISTHDGVDNVFNEKIKETLAGKTGWSHHKITLQDALKDGLYKRICERTKQKYTLKAEEAWKASLYKTYGEGSLEELDCIPSRSGGSWLNYSLLENNYDEEIPVIRYAQTDEFAKQAVNDRKKQVYAWFKEYLNDHLNCFDKNLQTFVGYDFARSGDGSDIWVIQQNKNLSLSSKFILEMRNLSFKDQEYLTSLIFDNVPNFNRAAIDATGNGAGLAEALSEIYGSKIIEQKMNNKWYEENMPPLKSRLEDKELSIPKHADITADFRLVKIENGIAKIGSTRTKGSDGKMRHGDSVIAAALAVQASKNQSVEFVYNSVGNKRSNTGLDEYNRMWG